MDRFVMVKQHQALFGVRLPKYLSTTCVDINFVQIYGG